MMNDISQFLHDHAETLKLITPICALVVSAVSIILAFLALLLQRRHHFKSLTPVPNFLFSDYENLIVVKLRNAGVGPLIIEKFTVVANSEFKNSLISWMPSAPKGMYWDTFTEKIDGWCIAPNHEVLLLKLSGALTDTNFLVFRNTIRSALSQLTVSVTYKDIYGNSFDERSRSLDWFARSKDLSSSPDAMSEAGSVVSVLK